MTPERYKQVGELYRAALELAPEQRAAFLAEACGDDEALRQEVASLLGYQAQGEGLIDQPALEVAARALAEDRARSPVGQSVGHYQILSLLGKGGMGEVYRARDVRLGREVAIKVLPTEYAADADRLRRFEQEARAAGMLNHPNVLTIYDIGTHAGAPFIVAELLEGETLRGRLREKALPLRRVIDYALQIARGLQAAHAKGIVHRDLKPENLFLTKDGRVKILDFGLAKLKPPPASIDTNASTQPLSTASGVVMGTPHYMAPEQVRAEEVDHRADIFAFGAILYEMLAGRQAFQGHSAVEVMNAILKEEPPEIAESGREVPPALARVMRHCLEKDPAERFQSIGDVAFYLEALAGAVDPASASQARAAREKSYGRLGWIVAAALLLVAAALFILYFRQRPGSLPAQTTIKQLTNYTGTETAGALSPDGRHFAFVSEKGGAPDIWVRQVSGGDPLQITHDEAVESGLAYAADGETIYYVSQGAIWRVGALGGVPRKVVQDAGSPSPSADGKQLAYVTVTFLPGMGNRGAIEIANADGSSPRRLHEGRGIGDVKLSPDNRWIAYNDGDLFEPRPLKLIDVRSRETRIVSSSTTGRIWSQAWLPDSRHLVVSREFNPGPTANRIQVLDLELVSIDGNEPRRLTLNVNSSFISPSLSADGKRLLVTMPQRQHEIWTVPLGSDPKANGAAARRLLDSSWNPAWHFVSRDGGTILFNSLATGSSNLWTMPADASAPPRQITTFPGNTVMHSSLSPDGARIAYASNQTGNSEIWIMNIDGSNPVQVTHDPAEDFWPTWSPDGSWLAFGSLRGGEEHIWKVPVGGGQAVRVSDERGVRGDWIGDRHVFWAQGFVIVTEAGTGKTLREIPMREWTRTLPVWSPDGRRFTAIRSDSYLRDSIWIFDADTGDRRLAAEFPGRFHMIFRAAWGKDAKSLIVQRIETISHIGLIENF
jgi:Tol biopolymer transport system component